MSARVGAARRFLAATMGTAGPGGCCGATASKPVFQKPSGPRNPKIAQQGAGGSWKRQRCFSSRIGPANGRGGCLTRRRRLTWPQAARMVFGVFKRVFRRPTTTPVVMLQVRMDWMRRRHNADPARTSQCSGLSRPVLLLVTGLLLGIFLCFPVMHQLQHAHDECAQPSSCAYYLLQTSLLLYFIPLILFLTTYRPLFSWRCPWSSPRIRQQSGSPIQSRAPPTFVQVVY